MHVGVRTGNPMIAFSGEIDMAVAVEVSFALQPLVEAGGPVTVDLSEVTFMDSTGIHAVLEAAEALGDRGCIIIHGAHDGIREGLRPHHAGLGPERPHHPLQGAGGRGVIGLDPRGRLERTDVPVFRGWV